jgi:hypothetical protein
MSKYLSSIINKLKQNSPLNSHPHFIALLNNIDNYSENEKIKAYLLGYFFKKHFDSDYLDPIDKEYLISEIKARGFSDYFYLKEKPEIDTSPFYLYAFLILGLGSLIVGILLITSGYYAFLVNVKWQTLVFREGGYYIMFGLICFVGAILSLRFERKRKKFIKSYLG